MNESPPPIKHSIYIDASSLKSDSLCDRRYLNHIIRGYSRGVRAANYKAGYGTAFHAFLQEYYSWKPSERVAKLEQGKAIAAKAYSKYVPYIDLANPKEFRTPEHLAKTVEYYTNRYQYGDSIQPLPFNIPGKTGNLLETKFCVPYYEADTFIIYLTGTIDMVADYGGQIIIVDHKSTGAYDIADFFVSFDMNIQTQFYVHMFKELTKMDEYVPILVNGIFIKKPTKDSEKTGIFDGVQLQRSKLIEYTKEQMEDFKVWLDEKLLDVIDMLQEFDETFLLTVDSSYHDLGRKNYAACDMKFGRCLFFDVCKAPPQHQVGLLLANYVKEEYNPLHFND